MNSVISIVPPKVTLGGVLTDALKPKSKVKYITEQQKNKTMLANIKLTPLMCSHQHFRFYTLNYPTILRTLTVCLYIKIHVYIDACTHAFIPIHTI
jgi:hypothetical protein